MTDELDKHPAQEWREHIAERTKQKKDLGSLAEEKIRKIESSERDRAWLFSREYRRVRSAEEKANLLKKYGYALNPNLIREGEDYVSRVFDETLRKLKGEYPEFFRPETSQLFLFDKL